MLILGKYVILRKISFFSNQTFISEFIDYTIINTINIECTKKNVQLKENA